MKNILLYMGLAGVLFAGCDPNEEIYEELDAQNSNIPAADLSFTLSDADYGLAIPGDDDAIGNYKSFNSVDEVKQYVPNILKAKYPHLGNGSSALVTYNLYRGSAAAVGEYTSAETYEVTKEDYQALGGDAAAYNLFTYVQGPKSNIPGILENGVSDATEGDLVLVTFDYANEVVDPSVVLTLDKPEYQAIVDYIETGKGANWIGKYGDQEYYYGAGAYYRNFEGRINTRKGWITNNGLDDNLFEGSTSEQEDSLRIEGRIQEGIVKFLQITYPNAASEIEGVDKFFNVTYAVYYGSATKTYNVQYQSDDAGGFDLVTGPTTDEIPTASASEKRGLYYTYAGGEWKAVDSGIYYLSSADYDAMGAPGKYDNFSSSVSADNYLPALLEAKYPYAQEEDEQVVTYKYYSSSANNGNGGLQIRGDLYTFTNGSWMKYQSTIEETLQFGNENGIWVPDNTIKYMLTSDDFALIGANFPKASGDIDNYNNINLGKYSNDEILSYLDAVLKNNFPNAAVGQKYLVTFATYNPRGTADRHVILTDSGDYEYVK